MQTPQRSLAKKQEVGSISDLLEYLSTRDYILMKERAAGQHMQRVMNLLNQENMQTLQKQFRLYPKGLQLPTFIYLMKKLFVADSQMSKYYFVSDLIRFFQAIDINGDGHLEWNQFTEYIIENIRRADKTFSKNGAFRQNEIISSAYSRVSNEYKLHRVIDSHALNAIKKVVYSPRTKQYYTLQAGSNLVRVYSNSYILIDTIPLGKPADIHCILDFSIDKINLIFGALYNNSIVFCNLKVSTVVKSFSQYQTDKMKNFFKLQYLQTHKMWAVGSKLGELKLFSVIFRSRSQAQVSLLHSIRQHQGLITDIAQLCDPQAILTSSIDGALKLYFHYLNKSTQIESPPDQTVSVVNSKNKKGILGIDISKDFGHYMLSYGFSSSVYIYNLQISLSKGFVGKYTQHSSNLIAAKLLKNAPFALSLDEKLNLRVWDFRSLQTTQVMNCQKYVVNPSRLQIIPDLAQLLICDKKVTIFKASALETKSKQINQFHNIFDIKVCTSTNYLFLFSSNDVRIYDNMTGNLKNVFTKLSEKDHETNITAAQFGYQCRKFYIGDAAGLVRQYCSDTGQLLQQIHSNNTQGYQNKQISKIIFLKEQNLLVVCSIDGRIMSFQKNTDNQFQMIKDIRDAHEDLTCASSSPRNCLIATADQNGILCVWNLQKFNLQKALQFISPVIDIFFSPIHSIMLVIEKNGILSAFHVPPQENSDKKYNCFAQIQLTNNVFIKTVYFDLLRSNLFKPNAPLLNSKFDKYQFICTLGLQDGSLLAININPIISKFNVQECHTMHILKKSAHCQIQSVKIQIAVQLKRGNLNWAETSEKLPLNLFKSYLNFEVAHSGPVQKVYLSKSNLVIVTSAQKKAKLWSLQGQLYGVIDFMTFKRSQWKVGRINLQKYLQSIQTTIYSIKLIQNRRFSLQEQQRIKVSLLMKYIFAQQQDRIQYLQWLKSQNNNISTNTKPALPLQTQQKPEINSFNQIYSSLVNDIKQKINKQDVVVYKTVLKPVALQHPKVTLNGSCRLMTPEQAFAKIFKQQESLKSFKVEQKIPKKKKFKNILYHSLKLSQRDHGFSKTMRI